jgi:hypothetical protein
LKVQALLSVRLVLPGNARPSSRFLTLMLPKEHGAYGQLLFPMVTAFAVAGVSPVSGVAAAAMTAGFLAHEPLLVWLGRRGSRAKREDGRRAMVFLLVEGAIALGGWLTAALAVPPGDRWAFVVPVVAAVALMLAVLAGREKSTTGELVAAAAFSLSALPLCVAAGAQPATGLAITTAFGLVFSASTLAVRAVILRVRAGGNPRAANRARMAALCVAVAGTTALALAGVGTLWARIVLVAAVPGLLVTVWLALAPPPPAKLRRVGWGLVAASAATGVIVGVGLTVG